MKAVDYIQKLTDVRENNSLNEDDSKTVKVWIDDLTEFGDNYLEDDDRIQLGKFFSKFPEKPSRPKLDRSKTNVKANNAGQRLREMQQERYNPNGRQFTLDSSRMQPRKKKLEVEGVFLDRGDEVHDKSSGKTIVVHDFESRPEGIYILGTTEKGEKHEFHRDNAKLKTKKTAIAKATDTPAKAKAKVEKEEKEAKEAAEKAEKEKVEADNAKAIAALTDSKADKVRAAEQAKQAKKAKTKAEKEAKEAKEAAEVAKKSVEKEEVVVKKEKAKKAKELKKGAYVDFGKEVIRVEKLEQNNDGMTVIGRTRSGKELVKTNNLENFKIVDFQAFNFQESEGKPVVEISEEVRILNAFLELKEKQTKNGAENLVNRINQFSAEYVAEKGRGKNPFRIEINAISDSLSSYLTNKNPKVWVTNENIYTQIVEKADSERLYESVRVVKYFSTWAKRTVTQDNIKELQNRIELSRKRKDIKSTNPLYKDVVEIEKILISMQSGGSYTFPDLGLGDVVQGLAGTRKMIRDWGKDAEKRAKAIIKKVQVSPQKEEKKSFFSRLFS